SLRNVHISCPWLSDLSSVAQSSPVSGSVLALRVKPYLARRCDRALARICGEAPQSFRKCSLLLSFSHPVVVEQRIVVVVICEVNVSPSRIPVSRSRNAPLRDIHLIFAEQRNTVDSPSDGLAASLNAEPLDVPFLKSFNLHRPFFAHRSITLLNDGSIPAANGS